MIKRLLRLLVALFPLLAGLALLRLMSVVAESPLLVGPRSLVRLDPLGLVGIVLLGLGAAMPRRSLWHTLRQSLVVALAGLALLVPDGLPRLVLLCIVSLLLVDELGWDWYLALLVLGIATFAASVVAPLPASIVAAYVGIYPPVPPKGGLSHVRASFSPFRGPGGHFLRPLWLLLLLRSLEAGPWPLQWTLLVPLLGIVMALWTVAGAFVEVPVLRRLPAAVLLLAFAVIGFGTTLGVAGALWIMLMYALLILWIDDAGGGMPIVPIAALFLATWWAAAAAAGARSMLPAAAAWLVGIAGGAAVLLWPRSSRGLLRPRPRDWLLLLALVPASMAGGLLTRLAAEPVAAQLGAGLSAFGLVDSLPWIGVAGLDPGHRRVALLPLAPLVPLLLVLVAIAWLSRHLWLRSAPVQSSERADPVSIAHVTRRVWWLSGGGDG